MLIVGIENVKMIIARTQRRSEAETQIIRQQKFIFQNEQTNE